MNRHDIGELYDLRSEREERKKPLYVSNQFIHAYTGMIARDEKRNWSDVYVVSDYDRNKVIWRVPISEIRKLFSTAIADCASEVRIEYDEKRKDYVVLTD